MFDDKAAENRLDLGNTAMPGIYGIASDQETSAHGKQYLVTTLIVFSQTNQ